MKIQSQSKYKTPVNSICGTLDEINNNVSQIERFISKGKFAEALNLKDELENILSTLGDQLETHV